MNPLFLICALTLPSPHFRHAPIVAWKVTSKQEQTIIDWIKRHNPGADVFIHEKPQEDLLKKNGYEKIPFTHNGKQIWIKRWPNSDTRRAA